MCWVHHATDQYVLGLDAHCFSDLCIFYVNFFFFFFFFASWVVIEEKNGEKILV